MEPNKTDYKKVRKTMFLYTMVLQMIFTVTGLAFVGYFIGTSYRPDTDLDLLLTAVGTVLGLIVSVSTFVKYLKREAIYEKHHRD